MERRVNYLLVGLFTLVLTGGLIAFVIWAHQRGDGKPLKSYAIFFDQAVNGLSLGSSVRYLGMETGRVEAISLDTAGKLPRVRVEVGIDAGLPVVQGTMATLKPSGITGVSFIDLRTDPSNTAPLATPAGSLPVINSESSGFDRIFDGASDSLRRLDLLLNDENLKLINKAFANLDSISGRIDAMLAAHQASLDRLLGPDMDELAETIRATHRMMDSITALTRSLDENPSQLIFPKPSRGVRIDP
jgi:phospholipid/cholesterol/gamma-HCH transport system substrate-binding protein